MADEIALISAYGSEVLGVCLSGERLTDEQLVAEQAALEESLDIPVVAPLLEGVERLVEPVRRYLSATTSSPQRSSTSSDTSSRDNLQ